MILTVALTSAGTLAATHFAPIVGKWLGVHKPRLVAQALALEADAKAELQSIVSTVERALPMSVREDAQSVADEARSLVAQLAAMRAELEKEKADHAKTVEEFKAALGQAPTPA